MCRSFLKPASPFLLRDFIQQSLYHSAHGYFSSSIPPILSSSSISSPILNLRDRQSYEATVSNAYREHDHGWMTPVQLFSPHLSHAIANRILSSVSSQHGSSSSDSPIHIIEIGPGMATLAHDILSFFPPSILSRLRYSLIEVSPTLSRLQASVVSSWVKAQVAVPVLTDARDWSPDIDGEESHVHIIATEVLDNLPHDFVRIQQAGRLNDEIVVEQARVHVKPDADMNDRSSRSLHWDSGITVDAKTTEAMNAFDLFRNDNHSGSGDTFSNFLRKAMDTIISSGAGGSGGGQEVWVPTGCYQLLESLLKVAPNASFTIADFTSFPGTLPGLLGPVVQRVRRGSAFVYDTVHEAPFGEVDIMFPTDFHRVAHAHDSFRNGGSKISSTQFNYEIITQADFFNRFANEDDIRSTTCKDGFNPVLQDFKNVSILMIDPKN